MGMWVSGMQWFAVMQTKKVNTARSELRICVKEEVDVLVSLSLIVLTVSADVKQH